MTSSRDFADRLARLTYLCSEISKIAHREQVPTERLEDILSEGEELCRAIRRELKKRDGSDSREYARDVD